VSGRTEPAYGPPHSPWQCGPNGHAITVTAPAHNPNSKFPVNVRGCCAICPPFPLFVGFYSVNYASTGNVRLEQDLNGTIIVMSLLPS